MGLSHTVSGDIASFRTPSRVPIESLKFHFRPKQEGSGDPSPTNVRPITGWTGLNGKRAGKNIGDIMWSVNGGDADAVRKLSNNYGTSINTLDYIYPDGPIIITQTKWDNPNLKRSYMNGYVAPVIPNLQRDGYYDVSFKVTNITSNPLNASLSDMTLSDPYGNGYLNPTVIDNVVIFKNYQHCCKDTSPNKKHFELRICGMNCTISELMVTPANKSDGVFEPYFGSAFPVTFPILSKNLLNPRSAMFAHGAYTINGDLIKQTTSDGRGWDSDSQMPPIKLPAGTYTISCSAAIAINFRTSADNYSSNTRFENGVGTFTIGNDVGIKFKCTSSSYPVLYTLQIEAGSVATEYEPFLYGSMWFGGYYDPVAGELVYSWRKFKVKDCEWTYKPGNHRFQMQLSSDERANASGSWTNFAISDSYKQSNQQGYQNLMIATYSDYYIYIRDDTYEDADDFVEAMGEVEIAYELANSIHIPIAPQDLKAFLDHNNFWSDANDITEVTYAVMESKDILAARKKAMDFDMGHHKKVKWNQVVRDGDFTGEKVDASKWALSRSDMGSLSISDNIATWTCTSAPSYYYQTGITWSGGSVSSYNYLAIPWNHLMLVKCKARCTIPCKVRLFALVGSGAHVWAYNENIEANTWTDIVGFIPNRNEVPTGEDDGFIKRFKPCITGISNISEIVVGTEFKIKELMAFDLTQMFGLGNEPSTVAEFEHICEINGIDLTAYQPYDAGSDRWLILP